MNPHDQSIQLQDLPLPRQDEILEQLRHLRAIFIAHKMYPIGHKMIIRSIARFHQHTKEFLQNHPLLVVSVMEESLEINGERLTRPLPERQYATELSFLFKRRGLESLIFHPKSKIDDLLGVFGQLMDKGGERDERLDFFEIQRLNPSVYLNINVVRRSTGRIRDKLSVEEIVRNMDRSTILQELGIPAEQLQAQWEQTTHNIPTPQRPIEKGIGPNPPWSSHRHPPMEFSQANHFLQANAPQAPWNQRRPNAFQPSRTPIPSHLQPHPAEAILPTEDAPYPLRRSAAPQTAHYDWHALHNQPVTEFPRHLQPQVIVQKPDLNEWIRSGALEDFLETYFSSQKRLSQRLELGDPQAIKNANKPFAQTQIKETIHQCSESLATIRNPQAYDQFQNQVIQQIQELAPEILNQYLLHMSNGQPVQDRLRTQLLRKVTPQKLGESQTQIFTQLARGIQRQQLGAYTQILQEMVAQQIEQGLVQQLTSLLHRLEQYHQAPEAVRRGAQAVQQTLIQPNNLEHLVQQGSEQHGADARTLLSQLAPHSVPHCLQQAISPNQPVIQQNIHLAMLVQILQQSLPAKRRNSLAPLLDTLETEHSTPKEYNLLLELSRQFTPNEFEKRILRDLAKLQDPTLRMPLIQQAISHDSPAIRRLFHRLVLQRFFSNHPAQEELVLQYLHRIGEIDSVALLGEWLHDTKQNPALRQGAIWMLGAFHTKESLQQIKRLLFQTKEDNDPKNPFVYEESYRFQALHTLTRMNLLYTAPIFEQLKKDPSFLLKEYASFLLQNQPAPSHAAHTDETTSQIPVDVSLLQEGKVPAGHGIGKRIASKFSQMVGR